MQSSQSPPNEACHAAIFTSSSMSGPQRWEDLLESLLHQIIALFSSYHDLVTFIGTCHSWRAAFSSYPSKFTFAFPPLVLEPDMCPHRNYYPYNLFSETKWQLVDPTNTTSSIHCSVPLPQNTLDTMHFVGCSYGYLILSYREQCVLVDVCTGTQVRPPQLPSTTNCDIDYGILTAPLSSPNSHLLVCTKFSLIQWQVGSHTWSEQLLPGRIILFVVVFKGEIFAMDSESLFTVRLAPQLSVQDVTSLWGASKIMGVHYRPWLVVCGDMLLCILMVISYSVSCPEPLVVFEAFCLDLSAEPAKLVKVEKLDNWALFVGTDRRSPTFACMNPERWGGKSNCVYVARTSEDSTEPWIAVELGQASQRTAEELKLDHSGVYLGGFKSLEPLWVYPSMISCVDQSSLCMARHGLLQ